MAGAIEEMVGSGPVLTDGAWGTELQARGLGVGDAPDGWNLTHPERVEEVASAYVAAGSQVIITNTFGSNRYTLERHGLADQVAQINREGVAISRRAAAGRARVFASVGPSGVMLMMGKVTAAELQSAFVEQIEALAAGGADAVVLETMTDLAEIKLAIDAARQIGLPVVACMTFDSGKNHDRTMMGTTPEEAAEALVEAGADAIGSNCGQGIEGFVAITERLRAATDRPLWIKANAGLPSLVDGQTTFAQTAGDFASFVPALVSAGADFVGGCCGTSPDFIRAVKEKLQA